VPRKIKILVVIKMGKTHFLAQDRFMVDSMDLPFFEFALLVVGGLKNPISCYVFKVIPPLLAVIGFAVAQPIVSSDSKTPGHRGMSYGPAYRSME
jgi:hypothetical protein